MNRLQNRQSVLLPVLNLKLHWTLHVFKEEHHLVVAGEGFRGHRRGKSISALCDSEATFHREEGGYTDGRLLLQKGMKKYVSYQIFSDDDAVCAIGGESVPPCYIQ